MKDTLLQPLTSSLVGKSGVDRDACIREASFIHLVIHYRHRIRTLLHYIIFELEQLFMVEKVEKSVYNPNIGNL